MRIPVTPARVAAAAAGALSAALPALALAQENREGWTIGKPEPDGIGFQTPVTPVMHDVIWLDDLLLILITAITLFVTALIGWCIFRYNAKANPTPKRFTHNAVVEVIWTAVPVLILIVMAIPSLRLLFFQLEVPEPDLTIKAVGNQWYWSYEYPDDEIEFDAFMLAEGELEEYGYTIDEHLLATDERVVVPVGQNVQMLVTGSDVIHAWTIPAFGSKVDAIPGRVNDTWFNVEQPGIYFGQCSELCGKDHAYMPIVVQAVTPEEFEAWKGRMLAKKRGDTEVAAAE